MNSSHFIHKFRHSSNQQDMAANKEEEEEESPTELNTINSSGRFLIVSPDKLSLKYTGAGQHCHDVGVVQSNKPAPFKRHAYYFEIYVKDAGVKGRIAIGFTNDSFKTGRHPGWELNTCGYHGEDGLIYLGKRQGEAFGPAYKTGDTVGAGINYDSQEFFFTVNGTLVGTVSKYIKVKGPLFPTVAVHSQNEEVTVNFGQEKFAFDFKGYEASERKKQQIAIAKTSIPPNMNHSLVKNYLLHFGYEDTFHAFDLATNSTVPPIYVAQEDGCDVQDTAYALKERKIFRQLIGKGEIDAALAKLRDCYPQLVQDDKSEVCFLLHCQKFIELVRIGALEEAVKYGRVELAKFIGLNVFQDIVEDCFALLLYERPEESNVGYFLEASQREVVADAVNAAILSTNPKHKDWLYSHLETLLRQLMACCLELRLLNDGQGESWSLGFLRTTVEKG
ncbi:SPla/RYanodine receptor [Hirschfeldia incana]|nr:SPla/RYanodine receptor [Hirschfeldia incana]